MLPALRKSFDRMEASRLRILQLTQSLTEPEAHVSPGPGEWSVVQVVEHMVTIDQMVLKFVQKQLAREDLRPAGMRTWMRAMLVTMALRYRKKIKAPARLPQPAGTRSLAEWRNEWEASRRQWRETLEPVPEKLRHKEVFKHPLAGYFTLGQTLDFITEHTLHHVPQVKRLAQKP
ncbi:MAG: hypothetical protein AVDCRST_MAG56-2981 [uncultured Cytophagales bacterium]|uniref:DinB-like domain-containing protein n=1 Tax=uncultured Cytophagales bacterium TaxID=158755 RepID=A0A6J4J8K7_9SPHI|nr:MAG: hypothetical protein AVDCRST_MAG56-2981 [uncultured Cytophagales bacterium]